MSRAGFGCWVVVFLLSLGASGSSRADDAADLAKQALAECNAGRLSTDRDVRIAHFTRGTELAGKAVAANDLSADAHFALFCNSGEQLRVDGERITSVLGFKNLMRELDRTLELNPEYTDALAAKGQLLV